MKSHLHLPIPLYTALLVVAGASLLSVMSPSPLPQTEAPTAVAPSVAAPAHFLRRNPLMLLPSVERTAKRQEPATLPVAVLPPQPELLPPPQPVAPPTPALPIRYLGRMQDDDRNIAFLILGSENLTAIEGDVLNGVWRLDKIEPSHLQFTYLPGQSAATLEIAKP